MIGIIIFNTLSSEILVYIYQTQVCPVVRRHRPQYKSIGIKKIKKETSTRILQTSKINSEFFLQVNNMFCSKNN